MSLSFEPPVQRVLSTTATSDGEWRASGTVTFRITSDKGNDIATLDFPFRDAPNYDDSIRQAAAQLLAVAKILARHAESLAHQ